jgi:hypothetical protein
MLAPDAAPARFAEGVPVIRPLGRALFQRIHHKAQERERMSVSPSIFKAACNRSHARKRGMERYGLSGEAVAEIEARVRYSEGGPDVIMLRPDHRGKDRALFAVRWEDRWVLPVFDMATDSIVTFVPPRDVANYAHVLGIGDEDETEPEAEPEGARPFDPMAELPPLPAPLPADATPGDHDWALSMVVRRQSEVQRRIKHYTRRSDWRRDVLGSELEYVERLRGELRKARHAASVRLEPTTVPVFSPDSPEDVDLLLGIVAAMREAFRAVGWDAVSEEAREVYRVTESRLRAVRRYQSKHERTSA